ncbi:MAG: thymidine phosphorylase family protein [Rickettsiales bacterium]|nr:thymidine phosphorylase family protein [Rickettsiales bacterium]
MTKLKCKILNIDTGREPIIFLNGNSSVVKEEGFSALARIKVSSSERYAYTTLYLSDMVGENEVGLSSKVESTLKAKNGEEFEVAHMEPLLSFSAIRNKLRGKPFTEEGIFEAIKDVVDGKYSDMHMACLCSATEGDQLSPDEIAYFAKAMVNTGKVMKWNYDIVVDKHCIGGIPGNRTTPPAIAIVAEYGLHIPKTSSRAITSPAGTADVMEVLTNIVVPTDRMKEVVDKAGGCLIWGGAVDLNPSDDIIINVKKDLDLDSKGQMLASILSKKVAAGSTHILIDVPYGPSAKTKSKETAEVLKNDFETLGKKLGVKVIVNLSDGRQPVGNGVGPALEALDVVKVLKNDPDAPKDLKEKTIYLSGLIIEFDPKVKKGEGEKIAREILESGRAWERFLKICDAQGGGLKEIPVAKFTQDILADKDGEVYEFDNRKLSYLAKLAGCPSQKAAGVYLYKHLGDKVKKGEKLFTIHSNSKGELDLAIQLTKEVEIIKIK